MARISYMVVGNPEQGPSGGVAHRSDVQAIAGKARHEHLKPMSAQTVVESFGVART